MNIFKSFFNLFLQTNCPLCQRSTPLELCQYCTKQLKNNHFQNPDQLWKQPLPVFVWGNYSGNVKRAIAMMKYENQPQIGRLFGQWLGEAWLSHPPYTQKILVVPIPLHPSKQKQRGYNQAALIAEGFCQITGFQYRNNALVRIKETKAQFGLSVTERETNVATAFSVNTELCQRPPDIPLLLIDDIYTTGATAKSAISTFHKNGINVLGLAAVATTTKGMV
ncbi:MAG TPA: ComF family protein [Nostocaceae cyanobacterium]|nr:ComF family protein [Nostocaceae cyanobacterium]